MGTNSTTITGDRLVLTARLDGTGDYQFDVIAPAGQFQGLSYTDIVDVLLDGRSPARVADLLDHAMEVAR